MLHRRLAQGIDADWSAPIYPVSYDRSAWLSVSDPSACALCGTATASLTPPTRRVVFLLCDRTGRRTDAPFPRARVRRTARFRLDPGIGMNRHEQIRTRAAAPATRVCSGTKKCDRASAPPRHRNHLLFKHADAGDARSNSVTSISNPGSRLPPDFTAVSGSSTISSRPWSTSSSPPRRCRLSLFRRCVGLFRRRLRFRDRLGVGWGLTNSGFRSQLATGEIGAAVCLLLTNCISGSCGTVG